MAWWQLWPWWGPLDWMPLRQAVKKAPFDALLPHLRNERSPTIQARAAGFFSPSGNEYKRENNIIPAWWWDDLHDVRPAINRAWFKIIVGGGDQIIRADGIEFQRVVVDELFSAPGGKPAEHDWNGAVKYVDDWLENNTLPRDQKGDHKPAAVDLMLEFFPPPKPKRSSVRRWLNDNSPQWW